MDPAVTKTEELNIFFELSFLHWEKHRMYPPNHERHFMSTLNDSHLKALARAEYFVQSGITNAMSPKMRDSIEHDILLLNQVHAFVRQAINEPGLPMVPEKIGQGNNGEKHGDTD